MALPGFPSRTDAQQRSGIAQLGARVAQLLHVSMYGRSNILKKLLAGALSTTKCWAGETWTR